MILVDTGPLVALCNQRDTYYPVVASIFGSLREPMLTTEACMGEAMHLLRRGGGWPAQRALWNLVQSNVLSIYSFKEPNSLLAASFMERFRDQTCDYADATLLVVAEEIAVRQVFTIDPHFRAYRLRDGEAMIVMP